MANTRYGALLAANQIRKRQKSQNPYNGGKNGANWGFKVEPLVRPRTRQASGITEVTRSKPKTGITEVTSSNPRTLRETLAMTGAGRRKRKGTR